MDKKDKPNNYVIFPRSIPSDLVDGKITKKEWEVLSWVRQNGNPYGIARVNISGINEDLFSNKKSINSVNKVLLSLRRKRYLYYKRRSGRRGSFDVHFGDWILPGGVTRSLDKLFNEEKCRGSGSRKDCSSVEVSQSLGGESQSFEDVKELKQKVAQGFSLNKVRGFNNDNEKDNYNNRISNLLIKNYKPKSLEEKECYEIACGLDETDMRFILSVKKKYSLILLRKAWLSFKEETIGKNIINKGAYFNNIVKRLSGQ